VTGVAASLNGVAAQIDLGTPEPVTPDAPAVPLGATIASKAAELGYDQERIFRFVADEVRYEPYAGALRGANGTLWSLAGNSVDKSLLLAALLDEALIEYRFAFGQIDDSTAAALLDASSPERTALEAAFARTQIAGLSLTPNAVSGDTPPATPPADDQIVDTLTQKATSTLDRAADLTNWHIGVITDALSSARIDVPAPSTLTLPSTEIERHTWLQVADGPGWIDLAPALNGSELGRAPASVDDTLDDLPAETFHMAGIRVVAEEWIGGANVRRDAVSLQLASADLVNVPVSLMVLQPSAIQGIGLGINELFTGQATFVPTILARDTGYAADVPIVFGASGGVLGSGGVLSTGDEAASNLGEGESLALWLAIDIASPGAEPITIERPVYDRIGFAGRQAESIDFAGIEPVTLVTDSEGETWVEDLVTATLISVDSAWLPFSCALQDPQPLDTYGAMAYASPALQSLRQGLGLKEELARGSQAWLTSPQITLTTVSRSDPSDPAAGIVLEFDLLHHAPAARRVPPAADAAGGLHPLILAGIVDQVAEQVAIESAARQDQALDTIAFGVNVGSIFAAALDAGYDIVTLSNPADLTSIDLAPEAMSRIATALEAGLIVIVPGQPVAIDGRPRSGWWLIDPATGQTRDELDTGAGGASIRIGAGSGVRFGPLGEATFLDKCAIAMRQTLGRLGLKIFCAAMFAFTGIGIGLALTTGSAIPAAGAVLTSGSAAVGGC
jgi:hypothetical protein